MENADMENADTLHVEVVYALAQEQVVVALEVPPGSCVEDAVRKSGILERFPEIDLNREKVGIFGKISKLDTPLHAGDRVEIYRHLIADPKEVRKQRAAEGKKMKKGGGDLEPEAKTGV